MECIRCGRDVSTVKLVDAIDGSEVVKICEECAVSENLPIVRMPTSAQLNESEKVRSVRQRLARMAGVRLKEEINLDAKHSCPVTKTPQITLDNLRKPRDYSKIIRERADLVKRKNTPLNLIDNFHWHIQMARRNRKMTLTQLSAIIGESELVLKMIEQGDLPDDAARIIGKIEQFFQIKLRRSEQNGERARIESAIKSGAEKDDKTQARTPARILNFDKESMKNITIDDLKKMKQVREDDWEEARKLAWGGKKKEEKEKKDEGVIGSDVEILDD